MTKKSASRVSRDKFKQHMADQDKAKANFHKKMAAGDYSGVDISTNMCWDDLNKGYEMLVGQLTQHKETADILLQNPNTLSFVKDKENLAANIRSLTRDLVQMKEDLDTSKAKHANRIGAATDPDDLMSAIPLFEEYQAITVRHSEVIVPTIVEITNAVAEAEHLMMGELKKQREAHPEIAEKVDGIMRQEEQEVHAELIQAHEAQVAELAHQEAQDVNVITDVDVK